MTNTERKVKINKNKEVTAYLYGDTLELNSSTGLKEKKIRVLPNKHYLNLETGEIRQMKITEDSREQNIASVQRTMKKLRRLIEHNFNDDNKSLSIVLTYNTHEQDTEKVYLDFKHFIARLRKKYTVDYIAVLEPQESGRWHLHVLLKNSNGKRLSIPNHEMATYWKKGFTSTRRIKSTDKIGNYLISYLSNIQNENKTKKGQRLHLYPKGVRIYRASRGIKQPIVFKKVKKEEILNRFNITKQANFSRYSEFKDALGNTLTNTVEFYNEIGIENTYQNEYPNAKTHNN